MLPLGKGGVGIGVLPADVVPIVDVEGEGDDFRPLRQLAQEGVGRRARAAALGGEELDDDRRLVLRAADGGEAGNERSDQQQGDDFRHGGTLPARPAHARITLR